LEPVEAARLRLHLLGGADAVVTQDDPAAAGRVAAHAELPVAQVPHAAVFARGAAGAGTDGARLDPGVVAARAAAPSQRRVDGRFPTAAAADKRFHSSAVNPFRGASKFSRESALQRRPA